LNIVKFSPLTQVKYFQSDGMKYEKGGFAVVIEKSFVNQADTGIKLLHLNS